MEIAELYEVFTTIIEVLVPAAEILILFLGMFYLLKFVQETHGGGIIRGFIFAFVGGFILLMAGGRALEMHRITYILETWLLPFFAFFLLVVFQPEIRRGLVRIGQSPLLQTVFGRVRSGPVEELSRAVDQLSKNRIGALITISGASELESYIEGGVRLDADISRELITTIFYPGTDLHDGAIIIEGDKIAAAGCLLPLTEDPEAVGNLGTRHRAGVGITVETDAACVIVSEETGNISVARRGQMEQDLSVEEMEERLRDIYQEQRKQQ